MIKPFFFYSTAGAAENHQTAEEPMLAVGELMREEVRVGAGRVRPSALSERQADSRVTNHLSNSQLDEGGDECVGTWVDKQALRVKKGDTCVRRVCVCTCVHVSV